MTDKYKSIIMPIIKKHAPQARVIIYGSRARGTHSEGADIDIALDAGKKLDRAIVHAIKDDLEESRLPILFDACPELGEWVVDFNAVSEDMQKEIRRDGVAWPQSQIK